MRKLLPTRDVSKDVLRRLMNLSILTFTLITLSFDTSFGQIFGQVECDCLQNGTTDLNGQFGETITIEADPADTWSVVSAEGFYSASSPVPPADPIEITPGTVLDSDGLGNFTLSGIRLHNTMWRVVFSDGTDTYERSSFHLCSNPSVEIIGDLGVCLGTTETYTGPISGSSNILWTVNGGVVLNGTTSEEIEILWNAVGTHSLSFTADSPSSDSGTTGTCSVSGETTVIVTNDAFPLACNNNLNISLNGQCELMLTADMILEDMLYNNDTYDLVLTDMENDTIIPGPMVGMEYINTVLMVAVVHECSGNSCWGTVTLEDKTVPPLVCPDDVILDCDMLMTPEAVGYPVPDDASVTWIGDNKYLVSGFDLCSDVTLEYSDKVVSSALCEGPYSSIIERSWLATDISGNETSCSFLININRATLADVQFPQNYDDVLGPNPSLMACGSYPILEDGNPDPSYTGVPTGTFCLNVEVDYEDITLPKCGDKTRKILREWTVRDICEDGVMVRTQFITVMDSDEPVCEAPADYTIGTGVSDCSSVINVIAPVVEDCSSTTYTVSYNIIEPGGDPYFQPSNVGVDLVDGVYQISELPPHNGEVYILYYIEDACGNLSKCHTKITIEDNQQPVPVCDLHTFVAVGENGEGYAGVDAFDDGSWDNCAIKTIEIQRMNNSPCGVPNTWGDKIKFCCEDIGNIVMVQLRVTDMSDNSNICMVEVEVQDNHDPEFTFCPENTIIDCHDDLSNLDQYGMATAIDNCGVTVTSSPVYNLNNCDEGTITRIFTATDNFGNTANCEQIISVVNQDPFYINPSNPNDPADDIIWPGSVDITNGCAGDAISPDNLPSGKQRPQILREGCSQVSMTHEDVVFQYIDDACMKILRKWTVIDDCRHFPPFGTEGIWTYTQIIKVQNNTEPQFSYGCNPIDVSITQLDDCKANVQVSALATDDCFSTTGIKYSYDIDFDNDGITNVSKDGRHIDEIFEFGTHKITWSAEDQCGNVETCDIIIPVRDNKAPTPYCLGEIVTVIMENSGEVTIWASDFDNGSFDNCNDQNELHLSFSEDITDQSLTISCEEMTENPQNFEVRMYVTDGAGNFDYCNASLIVQDNNNYCGLDNQSSNRISLGGHIYNDENQMLESVGIEVSTNLPEFPKTAKTDIEGEYVFENLLQQYDYMINPQSSGNHRLGVNTLDLVKIQRHILGLETIESPYKIIAADVTNDEKVTPADLLTLRKLILGLYDEFPNNESWKFVEANYTFSDPSDPFPYYDDLMMENMNEDYMSADFVAVKVGDVDGSASGFTTESDVPSETTISINTEEQLLAVGYNEIPFTIGDVENNIYGMQMVLALNQSLVSNITLSSNVIDIADYNYRYEGGKLYISAHVAQSVNLMEELFVLKVTTTDEAYVSDILSLEETFLKPQMIIDDNSQISAQNFDLKIANRATDIEHKFELYQNVPNPFTTSTDVSFVLPTDQAVTLTIMDVTGKLVHRSTGNYQKGYNVISLDLTDVKSSGLLHYQLDTDTDSETRKMIILR